ncbi:hypothetical protein [Bacillus hominis]|uniref:hypothetical protein n=1 Tax=Bacillus hominis TaxID=2817478 RepID=UPI001BB400B7|nr:hypothetical protein [Bacillus hominis]
MIGQYAKYCRMEAIITKVFDDCMEIYFKRPNPYSLFTSGEWVREIVDGSEFEKSLKPIFVDGKPVMVKKTIFGNIKYLNFRH